MKRFVMILVLGLLLLSISALAENVTTDVNNTVDDGELQGEIVTMSLQERAEFRFEQLGISLENQIEHAQDILAEVNVSDDVAEELEGYVIQLQILLEKVDIVDLDLDPAELASEFVSIRSEAIQVTNDFRITLHRELTDQMVETIRERTREIVDARKEQFRERLEEKKKNATMKRTQHLLETLGIEVSDDMTKEDIHQVIKDAVNNLTQEEKGELRDTLKEDRAEAKANAKQKLVEARENFKQNMQELRENIRSKIQERRGAFKEKLEVHRENLKQHRENLKEHREEIRQNRLEKIKVNTE